MLFISLTGRTKATGDQSSLYTQEVGTCWCVFCFCFVFFPHAGPIASRGENFIASYIRWKLCIEHSVCLVWFACFFAWPDAVVC